MTVRTGYGIQVDAWGALVMDQAEQLSQIEQDTIHNLKMRGIEGLTVTKAPLRLDGVMQEHIIANQNLGRGGRAAVALRLSKRGSQDLEISWRAFEKNVRMDWFSGLIQGILVVVGGFCIITGLFGALCMAPVFPPLLLAALVFLLPGIAMVGIAWGWWGASKRKTSAGTTEQFLSRALAATVDRSLMEALANNGVTAQHLKILQRSQTEGLGRLSKTDWIDEISRRRPEIDI